MVLVARLQQLSQVCLLKTLTSKNALSNLLPQKPSTVVQQLHCGRLWPCYVKWRDIGSSYSSPKMPFEPLGHSVTSTMEQSCRLIAVGYLNKEVIFAQKQSKPHDLHCSIVLTLHFKAVLVPWLWQLNLCLNFNYLQSLVTWFTVVIQPLLSVFITMNGLWL